MNNRIKLTTDGNYEAITFDVGPIGEANFKNTYCITASLFKRNVHYTENGASVPSDKVVYKGVNLSDPKKPISQQLYEEVVGLVKQKKGVDFTIQKLNNEWIVEIKRVTY